MSNRRNNYLAPVESHVGNGLKDFEEYTGQHNGIILAELNCYYNRNVDLPPLSEGILTDLAFTVKDLFDVKGHVSACGNPTWAATHDAATVNAELVDTLLMMGAHLKGKTQMNELAYGMDGDNIHFGMPVNPMDPEALPGGSSSGSAVAVAAGLVDFALGTDTAGSVRVPASYCGIFGIRPTHNTLSLKGVMPLSQSLDVAGFFAKDDQTFSSVATGLFRKTNMMFNNCVMVEDAFDQADDDAKKVFRNIVSQIRPLFNAFRPVKLSKEGLNDWRNIFRHIQGYEVWRNHGVWYTQNAPLMSQAISDRFNWAATITESTYRDCVNRQAEIADHVVSTLKNDTVLILPTVPGYAPSRSAKGAIGESGRNRILNLTCISGISGTPQVSIPCLCNGRFLGISILGPRGSDVCLIKKAIELHKMIN